MVKEDVFVALFGIGVFLLMKRKWIHGSTTALLSIICLLIVVTVVLPYFQGDTATASYKYSAHWSEYGRTNSEILKNMINPVHNCKVIFTQYKLSKMFNLFSVFLFTPLLGGMFAYPLLIPNLFKIYSSSNPLLNGPLIYYGLLITPFLFTASIIGVVRIAGSRKHSKKIVLIISILVFLIHLSNSRIFNGISRKAWEIPSRVATVNEIISDLPSSKSISAQIYLGAHIPVTSRRYYFPNGLGVAEYVLLDTIGNKWPLSAETYVEKVDITWCKI